MRTDNPFQLMFVAVMVLVGMTGAAGCPPPAPVPVPVDASLDSDVPPDPCTLETKKCPPCSCEQDAAAEASLPEAAPAPKDAAPEATFDSGPATSCTRACANLARFACKDFGPNCVQTCDHLTAEKLVPFSAECTYGATSVASIRKCPSIACKQ